MLNQEGAQVRREFVHQLFVKILVCQKIDVDFEPGRSTGMERTCSRAGVMDRNPSLERWPLTIGLYQKKYEGLSPIFLMRKKLPNIS